MDATTIALIKALSGGSGGLPPVTAADAGKFLRVNDDGAWIAAEIDDAEEAEF